MTGVGESSTSADATEAVLEHPTDVAVDSGGFVDHTRNQDSTPKSPNRR
jgi:hypothetical protein